MVSEDLLTVHELTTAFELSGGRHALAVDHVSFAVRRGETLGLVGESGSGKSVTALSIMRLVQAPGRIIAGTIDFRGRNLLALPERDMRRIRGAEIGLIFQEPMTALNPVFTIGDQIAEPLLVHGVAARATVQAHVVELLTAVGMPDPSRHADAYPHQLSGGMRQRALIAMAIACRPALLIADEPTTALDVTVQAQILELLKEMQRRFQLSLLLITHDLGVIAETADRVAVMYAGRIVEQGPVRDILRSPQHPYTRGLLASIPRGAGTGRLTTIEGTVPLLGSLPAGCAFAPRCRDRFAPCDLEPPMSTDIGPDHAVRCYLHTQADVTTG